MIVEKELLGFTAGNFDLLHPGYIKCFKWAKKHCDKFIIFLQKDPSATRFTKYKPVIPLWDRYEALKSKYRLLQKLDLDKQRIIQKLSEK